jgi:hypothetical protein
MANIANNFFILCSFYRFICFLLAAHGYVCPRVIPLTQSPCQVRKPLIFSRLHNQCAQFLLELPNPPAQ